MIMIGTCIKKLVSLNTMLSRLVLAGLLLVTALPFDSCANRQQRSMKTGPEDIEVEPLDSEERAMMVERVCELLTEYYVFPEVAEECVDLLRTKLKEGVYDGISHPRRFAIALTEDLRSTSSDKHMRIVALFGLASEDEEENRLFEKLGYNHFLQRGNFGFIRAEWKRGNVGYLDLRSFCPVDVAGEKVEAVMSFLSNMDAIIIDLRYEVMGGRPEMVRLITSYFFDKPVLLGRTYFRKDDVMSENWTLDKVKGRRMPDVPLYILTDEDVFSAGESFTYSLQALKRATVIGERTKGGAHITNRFHIGNRFIVSVPWGRAINPVTGTNWEGTGVEPDIHVKSEKALDVALKLARKKAEERRRQRENRDTEAAEELMRGLRESERMFEKGVEDKASDLLNEVMHKGFSSGVISEEFSDDIGYYFLEKGSIHMAIALFKYNATRFPNSYNTYHSLGEAYMKKGETELARINLEKSLAINPRNGWAKKMLREIKASE